MIRHLALITLLALTTACQQERRYEETIYSLGTLVDVTLYAKSPDQAQQAMALIRNELDALHHTWHAWKPGGLQRINRLLQSGEPFSLAPEKLAVIEKAKRLSQQSNGLFNPAVGKLIAAWGFHQDDPGKASPPTAQTIKTLLAARPNMEDIHIDGNRLWSVNPAVQLDFGGFVKGEGLGMIAAKLKASGIQRFILNAGGDLVVAGKHPNRPWRIAIRSPDGKTALASLDAHDGEGIFTSGDYERFYIDDGQRRHHIIDPRTGYPARGARAVTVIHHDPGLADAAATALLIAGPGEWLHIAEKMGIDTALLLDDTNTLHMTPAMAKRLQFSPGHGYRINPDIS